MTSHTIRRIDAVSPEDAIKGSETLHQAFKTDPLNAYTFAGRDDISRAWFSSRVRLSLNAGELYVVGDWAGIAIFEPAVEDQSARERARATFRADIVAQLGEEVGRSALGRFDTVRSRDPIGLIVPAHQALPGERALGRARAQHRL